ncbi:MAG: nuclear transport factor 2 family protein [Dehalococcoidia bacterium]
MTTFPRDEVKRAIDGLLETRAKVEAGELGWDALADHFTEDATYIDPAWGRFVGLDNIRRFMRDSMKGLDGWTFPVEWVIIDGNRVVTKFWNRLPGQRPDGSFYQAPGFQEIIYAGDGKFSYDEDLLNMVHVMEIIQESGWVPGPEVKMPENVVR